MTRAPFLACDAHDAFGAAHTGLLGSGGVWADFPTLAHAENFALYCLLEGYGAYLSRTFADLNRVMVDPDFRWRP